LNTLEIQGQNGSSRILIGESLTNLPNHLPGSQNVIITDKNVNRLYGAHFSGFDLIELETGEEIKTLASAEAIYMRLLEYEADRTTFVTAVGGGIVCDLAGFAASTYLRGLDFGYVATTLLAQVDASVGGKTGVNLRSYKNLVGVFNQPRFVICDLDLLRTLPPSEILSGMAEIVKHGLIGDAELFTALEHAPERALSLDKDFMEKLITASIRVKAEIVNRDEREKDERRKLNFGHTLGHALEKILRLSHGEAVSLGMAFAIDLSVHSQLLSESEARRIKKLLSDLKLPVKTDFDKALVMDALRKDKKRTGDTLHFVCIRGIGLPVITELSLNELEMHIHDLC
jgi:3-dehydroquinate synthase